MTGLIQLSNRRGILSVGTWIFASVLFLGPVRVVNAATHEVPAEFSTVGAALGACAVGDTVEVAPGVYAPSTNGESFPLTMNTAGILLRGAGMGFSILDAESSAGVLLFNSPTGRVTGFTITGGWTFDGGGVEIVAGGLEVDHNYILENAARDSGSGIDIQNSASPWIHHNIVWGSFDTDLGHPGDPHGLQYTGTSGGICEHNLIGRGDSNGLFYLESSSPTIRHNIFYENGIPGVRGRGICAFGDDNAVIAHNIFHANKLAALIVEGVGNIAAEDANLLDLLDGIYGNLDGDPLLSDPDNEIFTLLWPSPAIDAGDPNLPGDPDGTIADLGPLYFDQSVTSSPRARSALLTLRSNAPNPFNPSTVLRFHLERAASVRVELIDPRGRRLRILHEGPLAAGEQRIRFDGRNGAGQALPSGVYLASFLIEGERQTQPMVLVR